MLGDALVTVNASLFDEIVHMTPEQISVNGVVTLSRLQGQLLHERALIDLSIVHPEPIGDLPDATYPNPEDEIEEHEPENSSRETNFDISHFTPSSKPVGKPRQKRKYTRRKKKK